MTRADVRKWIIAAGRAGILRKSNTKESGRFGDFSEWWIRSQKMMRAPAATGAHGEKG